MVIEEIRNRGVAPGDWSYPYRLWLRLSGCFAMVFAASAIVEIEHCGHLIWVANGLGLAYLLLAPRWLWARYLAAVFCGMLAGGIVVGPESWARSTALSLCHVAEVALAAYALRKRSAQMPHFCDQRYLLRFAVYAIGGAPVLSSLLLAAGYGVWGQAVSWSEMANWVSTNGLGTAITTPACVALFQNRLKFPESGKRPWPLLLAMIPITIGAFAPWRAPLVFLIYPTVALILFRLGLGWAAMSTLFVTAVGSWFTIHNLGPFAAIGAALSWNPTVLLQLYLASGMFLIFVASSVLDTLKETERRLRQAASMHELVAENSRDVIIFADFMATEATSRLLRSGWGVGAARNCWATRALNLCTLTTEARFAALSKACVLAAMASWRSTGSRM